ncbi:MAG: aspartate/glutamate racemase family protein [Alphaproteobacteria bacterium]
MIGWRARLGFMVPPGNPTIEPEMIALAPQGVSLHFHRMDAGGGVPGALDNQDRRTSAMIDSLDAGVMLLAAVKPDIITIAHTATSYYLGRERESALLARLSAASGVPVVTAFGAVAAALERLQVRRIAYGAPYSAETTAQGRAHLEACGFTVVRAENLAGVKNIYDETAERAYRLARQVDRPEAEAVFLTGTGMPTLPVLDMLETDLGKPVISSASAMMWHALRRCGVRQQIAGYGRLLMLE